MHNKNKEKAFLKRGIKIFQNIYSEKLFTKQLFYVIISKIKANRRLHKGVKYENEFKNF